MIAVVALLVVIALALIALVYFAYLAPAPAPAPTTTTVEPTPPAPQYSVAPGTVFAAAPTTPAILGTRNWYDVPDIDTGLLP